MEKIKEIIYLFLFTKRDVQSCRMSSFYIFQVIYWAKRRKKDPAFPPPQNLADVPQNIPKEMVIEEYIVAPRF